MRNANLLLGVSGSIAAYKTPDLVKVLRKNNFNIKTILTKSSEEFVTKLSVATMSRGEVFTNNERIIDDWRPAHIDLADWADIALVAPASAATIGRLATSLADGLLAETFIALPSGTPKFIAPAMNGNMFDNPGVSRSLDLLADDGYQLIPPRSGELACGYEGNGKIASIETIINTIEERYHDKPSQSR